MTTAKTNPIQIPSITCILCTSNNENNKEKSKLTIIKTNYNKNIENNEIFLCLFCKLKSFSPFIRVINIFSKENVHINKIKYLKYKPIQIYSNLINKDNSIIILCFKLNSDELMPEWPKQSELVISDEVNNLKDVFKYEIDLFEAKNIFPFLPIYIFQNSQILKEYTNLYKKKFLYKNFSNKIHIELNKDKKYKSQSKPNLILSLNTIKRRIDDDNEFYFCVAEIKLLNIDQIISSLVIKSKEDVKKLLFAYENDISFMERVCFTDVISKRLIQIPVRGIICIHSQVFCYRSYLEVNIYKNISFKCPICKNYLIGVYIDDEFRKIIDLIRKGNLNEDIIYEIGRDYDFKLFSNKDETNKNIVISIDLINNKNESYSNKKIKGETNDLITISSSSPKGIEDIVNNKEIEKFVYKLFPNKGSIKEHFISSYYDLSL